MSQKDSRGSRKRNIDDIELKNEHKDENNNKHAKIICGICEETMDDKSSFTLPCSHMFHRFCIDESYQRVNHKCPLCGVEYQLPYFEVDTPKSVSQDELEDSYLLEDEERSSDGSDTAGSLHEFVVDVKDSDIEDEEIESEEDTAKVHPSNIIQQKRKRRRPTFSSDQVDSEDESEDEEYVLSGQEDTDTSETSEDEEISDEGFGHGFSC